MKTDVRQQNGTKALSHQQSGGGCLLGCFAYIFFGIFCLVGGINAYVLLFEPLGKYLAINSWAETPCEILESDLQEVGSSLLVTVSYEYQVAGKKYLGTRFRHQNHTAGDEINAARGTWRETLRPGSRTVCYVDPHNPAQAVLNNDFSPWILIGIVPLIFLMIGLTGILLTPRLQKYITARTQLLGTSAARKLAARQGISSRDVFDEDLPLESETVRQQGDWKVTTLDGRIWLPPVETGPRELKSGTKPLGTFIGLLFFALIWNGITSIFAWHVLSEWMNGRPPWFMTLFLLPFLAVGLGVVVGAIYALLALFNPRPQLYVSSPSVRLGETFRVKWVLQGRIASIRNFTVKLKGEEWAQYRQGTSTYTDTHIFHESLAVATSDLHEIESGETSLEIPAGAMHSIQASDNKIRWKIELQGEISFWPDVRDSYEISVLP